MRNGFLIILLSLLLIPITGFSDNKTDCIVRYKKVKFDYSIKSVRGWYRVCSNNRLYKYVKLPRNDIRITNLCKCIERKYDTTIELNKGAFDVN